MPAGKTYENIGQTSTLTSSATTITFSSISQDYTDLILIGNVVANANSTAVSFRVNSLTSSADYGHSWYGIQSDATARGGLETGVAYGASGWFTTPSTNGVYVSIMEFLNYTDTDKYKTVYARSMALGGAGSYPGNEYLTSTVKTTSAITSITLSLQTDNTKNFNAGTAFTLYGIKKA
jgi:hypothetical protein